MELAINKKIILNILAKGHWILDDSSSAILTNIQTNSISVLESGVLESKSLKGSLITYYSKRESPLLQMFYDKALDENFNALILEKIARDGIVESFDMKEQEKIINALREIKKLGTGCLHFVEDLSFVKMNSQCFKSASNPHLIGAIVLTNLVNYNDDFELSKSIIHELAHQELFLINFFDRLTVETSDGVSMFSPYQKMERPPIGRLHSLWALFRMIQFGQYMKRSIQNEMTLFKDTLKTLNDNIMTEFGASLIKTIRDNIEN